jgi:DNA polymerase III subunit epsilon
MLGAPFFGQSVVFTGRMKGTRQEAARRASEQGFDVSANVTPTTTVLCVGSQGGIGAVGSSKRRKAERLVASQHSISILNEEEFWRLLGK